MLQYSFTVLSLFVAPARERGLKFVGVLSNLQAAFVAPARERGLKWYNLDSNYTPPARRSREGAWIEISSSIIAAPHD